MQFYNKLLSPEQNWAIAKQEADFYKKMAANMRTQADALRALLISLNIPKEEIDEKQFAHLRSQVYHSGYVYTIPTERVSGKSPAFAQPHGFIDSD